MTPDTTPATPTPAQLNVGFHCPQCGAMRGVIAGDMIATREGRKFIADALKDGQTLATLTDDEVRASRWGCECKSETPQPSLFALATVTP